MRLRDVGLGRRKWEQVYRRQLPGGGFVTIEITAVHALLRQPKYRGKVIVERRADQDRRKGHAAPAVVEVEGASMAAVFHKLFPLAQSNLEIATRCLARTRQSLAVARTN